MGIDYGMGQTNIDTKTGIRFGVIPVNEVTAAWCEASEPDYGTPEPDDCNCPKCGAESGEINPQWGDSLYCEACSRSYEVEVGDFAEPCAFIIDDGKYRASSNSHGDIMIVKSPYFTHCGFCSPCAPGAGYLLDHAEHQQDCKAYCFDHEWFDDGRAPYKVFDVVTGEELQPC